ncbi:hypothetical protein A2U01_0118879, partial [Trifolium medium]|nr:hypothetical protein [Trifolium medium]
MTGVAMVIASPPAVGPIVPVAAALSTLLALVPA